MELISIQYAENDLNKTMTLMYDLLTATPDIKGVFTNNEITTIGVATVLEEKGLTGQIKHVGFDATSQTIDYLNNGITEAIVCQDAYQIGYQTVKAALESYQGKTFDGMIDTGVALVTPENVNDEDIQAIINPLG